MVLEYEIGSLLCNLKHSKNLLQDNHMGDNNYNVDSFELSLVNRMVCS
jgi:hypothetical protein